MRVSQSCQFSRRPRCWSPVPISLSLASFQAGPRRRALHRFLLLVLLVFKKRACCQGSTIHSQSCQFSSRDRVAPVRRMYSQSCQFSRRLARHALPLRSQSCQFSSCTAPCPWSPSCATLSLASFQVERWDCQEEFVVVSQSCQFSSNFPGSRMAGSGLLVLLVFKSLCSLLLDE